MREASLGLGANRCETIKFVVIKKAFPGVIATIILGFSRAFGETMAVLMVVGNVARVPHSVFNPAYPLPALIANNYGEMMSIPVYDSALMFAALLLLVIIIIFNILAKYALHKLRWGS
jgi:phosphate transport system permease protein